MNRLLFCDNNSVQTS